MSRGGGKSSGRHVTPDEAALWSHATRSLDKVKAKPRVTAHAAPAAPPPPQPKRAEAAPAKSSAAPPKAGPPPHAATGRRTPSLAEFDRRTFRQVAAGKVTIDARLDLHGLQQGDAYGRLRAFLLDSQARGHRMVLVITGKGGEADTGDHLARMLGRKKRGVLRRSVPQWLEQSELRAIVLSYTAAGLRHGSDGALYVRLRKARDV